MTKIAHCFLVAFLVGPAPAKAATLFQDNFNSYTGTVLNYRGDRIGTDGNHAWTAGNAAGSVVAGAGRDGSPALKVTFNCDSNSCGDRAIYWAPKGRYGDIWVKFDYKIECGKGSCAGGAKFLKIFGGNFNDNCTATHHNASLGTGGNSYDGKIGAWIYGDPRDDVSASCMDAGRALGLGIDDRDTGWHTFKVHARFNSNNAADGSYAVFRDGVLVNSKTRVVNRGNGAPGHIGAVELGGWNQSYGGIPYYYYYDNLVISDRDPDAPGRR